MSIFEFLEQYGIDLSSKEIFDLKAIVDSELANENLRLQKELDGIKPQFNPSLTIISEMTDAISYGVEKLSAPSHVQTVKS